MRTGSSGARIVRRRRRRDARQDSHRDPCRRAAQAFGSGRTRTPRRRSAHCSGPAEARVRNRVSVGCMGDWREEGRKAGCGVKWVKQVRSAPASSCEDDAENDGRETERARRGRRTAGLQAGSLKRREMIEESTAAGRRRRSPPSIPVVSKSRRRVPSDAPWASPMRRSRGACPQGPKGPLQRPAEGRRSFRPWR